MRRTKLIYGGRAERLFAYLIDAVLLVVISMVVMVLLAGSNLVVLASYGVSLAYYTYFTASSWQATPGKRLLNLRVIRLDGRPLTQRDALERFLAYSLPSLPIYASFLPEGVGVMVAFWLTIYWFSPILFTTERIGYHDRICRTRVVVGKAGA